MIIIITTTKTSVPQCQRAPRYAIGTREGHCMQPYRRVKARFQ